MDCLKNNIYKHTKLCVAKGCSEGLLLFWRERERRGSERVAYEHDEHSDSHFFGSKVPLCRMWIGRGVDRALAFVNEKSVMNRLHAVRITDFRNLKTSCERCALHSGVRTLDLLGERSNGLPFAGRPSVADRLMADRLMADRLMAYQRWQSWSV